MEKDKKHDIEKTIKQAEKVVGMAHFTMSAAKHVNWMFDVLVNGFIYLLMFCWLCLPLYALFADSLAAFKIFVLVSTIIVMYASLKSPAKLFRDFMRHKAVQLEHKHATLVLHPEMEYACDYQEIMNLAWAHHKKQWDAGNQITLKEALGHIGANNNAMYKNALQFIRVRQLPPPQYRHKKKNNKPGNSSNNEKA